MSQYLSEAFKKLNFLNEETFAVNTDGLENFIKFEDEDDFDDSIDVIDPEAETEEDLQDSYVGKVILDCCVCHSKIYKDKEDVIIEDDIANASEECPFCYSVDGFKVIGEVSTFDEDETDDEEEKEDNKDSELEESLKDKDNELSRATARKMFGTNSQAGWGSNSVDKNSARTKGNETSNNGQSHETTKNEGLFDKKNKIGKTGRGDYVIGTGSESNYKGFNILVSSSGQAMFVKDNSGKVIAKTRDGDIEKLYAAIDKWLEAHPEETDNKGNYKVAQVNPEHSVLTTLNGVRGRTKRDIMDDSSVNEGIFDGVKTQGLKKSVEKAFGMGYADAVDECVTAIIAGFSALKKNGKTRHTREVYSKIRDSINTDNMTVLVIREFLADAGLGSTREYARADRAAKLFLRIANSSDKKEKEAAKLFMRDVNKRLSHLKLDEGLFDRKKKQQNLVDVDTLEKGQKIRFTKNGKSNEGTIKEIHKPETTQFDVRIFLDNGVDATFKFTDKVELLEGIIDKSKSIKESVNNIVVETDDDIIGVTPDENGKVTISTEPKSAEEPVAEGEETIQPLEPETQAELEDNVGDGEEIEIDVDEFDEESFDELGEQYLHEVYDNVRTFKTTNVAMLNNRLVVEGVIKFKSGSSKKTSFIFESREATKTGKVRFIGENREIARGKKSFTVTGKVSDGKFLSESLNYNYGVRGANGKAQRLYGTVKRGK